MHLDDARVRDLRRDFPALERTQDGRPLAFFDGPGGTQVPRPVIEAVSACYATCNANSHGAFATSRDTDALVLEAREAAAALLGAPSWRCISFGANMTTLAFALSRALGRELEEDDDIVVTQLDHEANRGPWLALAERGGVVKEVRLRHDGTLDPEDLESKIGPRTKLVALGFASNALGTVNDVALARDLSRRVGARLVVDAVHAAPHFALDAAALDPDFLLCSAYKFYGPHIGILYAREGLLDTLRPDHLRTADPAAPFRIETGTLNHPALAGVTAAIHYLAGLGTGPGLRAKLVDAMTGLEARERALAAAYHAGLARIPGVTAWGPDFFGGRRAPTVSVTAEGRTASDLAARLAAAGLNLWDGHFYAARAVEVLGLQNRGGLLRAGMALYTLEAEVERLLEALARAVTGS